jgi:FkbM family methyltransferase
MIFMSIKDRIEKYNLIKKKIKNPLLFTINFYITTRFKKSFLKAATLKNGLRFYLKTPTDYILVLEYAQNYYDIDHIRKGNVCVDIGANTGDFSIFVSNKFKKLYSFEPIKAAYNQFNENIKLNNLKNINSFNLGVSDRDGHLKFNLEKYSGKSKIDNNGNITIGTITWSKLYSLINTEISLLKIDCEGSEYTLLNDPLILKHVKEIRMEMHIFSDQDKIKAHKLIELFKKNKFKLNLDDFKLNQKINTEVGFELILKK